MPYTPLSYIVVVAPEMSDPCDKGLPLMRAPQVLHLQGRGVLVHLGSPAHLFELQAHTADTRSVGAVIGKSHARHVLS